MNIIDCITYFDEDTILDLRLNELNNYVDKFVIIELNVNHRGQKKKQNFKIDKYKKFKPKINYLFYDKVPQNVISNLKFNKFSIENFQRNLIAELIKNFSENDLVMISDCDEIPNMKNFEYSKNKAFFIFINKMYYYKFNLQLYKKKIIQYPLDWSGTRACLNKNILYPQIVREIPSVGRYNLFRMLQSSNKIIYNGGWHFSFVRSPEFIKKKIQSYGHSEYNTDEINNLDNIKRSIKNHTDIFNRDILLIPKKIDNSFPKYIVENQKKLFEFIET